MTYKNTEVQPELFSGIDKRNKRKSFKKNVFSINYKSAISVSIDSLIVIIISLLMVNLLCFVIGIERGKHIIKVSNDKIRTTTRAKAKPIAPKVVTSPVVAPKVAVKKVEPSKKKNNNGYTIQLVTYNNNGIAEKEVTRLKANGVNGFVLKKGDYYVVYGGVFNTEKTAKKKLNSFKKRYKDCFVRFLKKS
ncbi:MAG: SPOR domain-containing protein [PVC group bacterium]|nr:SPOR domain-containing protein [PVC group bacterium]